VRTPSTAGKRTPNAAAPKARYLTVRDHIRKKIRSGQWKPGDRVPSEHELVAAFGLSRMTINRAVRELADQGELVRYAGVGTFVGEQKPQSGLLRVANIADEIRARGHEYSCDVVLVARESASLEVSAALGLRTGDGVFHSVCLHRENSVAVQLEDRYVNPKVAPAFLSQDFTRIRPTEYLLEAVPLDEVEHVVDAVNPTKKEAALLDVGPAEPCLVLTRRTWSGPDVVTFVRCLHPGSRYRLGSRFKTRGSQAFA
jgi:GntR family transcriptional regulator, histidine utilization repressor